MTKNTPNMSYEDKVDFLKQRREEWAKNRNEANEKREATTKKIEELLKRSENTDVNTIVEVIMACHWVLVQQIAELGAELTELRLTIADVQASVEAQTIGEL